MKYGIRPIILDHRTYYLSFLTFNYLLYPISLKYGALKKGIKLNQTYQYKIRLFEWKGGGLGKKPDMNPYKEWGGGRYTIPCGFISHDECDMWFYTIFIWHRSTLLKLVVLILNTEAM